MAQCLGNWWKNCSLKAVWFFWVREKSKDFFRKTCSVFLTQTFFGTNKIAPPRFLATIVSLPSNTWAQNNLENFATIANLGSCWGPCEKMLWRSWWNPVRGPCMILYRSLSRDLLEILVRFSLRGPCIGACRCHVLEVLVWKLLWEALGRFLGGSWEVLVSSVSSRSFDYDLGVVAWRSWSR